MNLFLRFPLPKIRVPTCVFEASKPLQTFKRNNSINPFQPGFKARSYSIHHQATFEDHSTSESSSIHIICRNDYVLPKVYLFHILIIRLHLVDDSTFVYEFYYAFYSFQSSYLFYELKGRLNR